MTSIRFRIQGSVPDPYFVSLKRAGDEASIRCSCSSGINGKWCKHKRAVLEGQADNIIQEDIGGIGEINNLIKGTNLEFALAEFQAAEVAAHEAQTRFAKAKVNLEAIARKSL